MANIFWRNCVNTNTITSYILYVYSVVLKMTLQVGLSRNKLCIQKNINKAVINYHLLLIIKIEQWPEQAAKVKG